MHLQDSALEQLPWKTLDSPTAATDIHYSPVIYCQDAMLHPGLKKPRHCHHYARARTFLATMLIIAPTGNNQNIHLMIGQTVTSSHHRFLRRSPNPRSSECDCIWRQSLHRGHQAGPPANKTGAFPRRGNWDMDILTKAWEGDSRP